MSNDQLKKESEGLTENKKPNEEEIKESKWGVVIKYSITVATMALFGITVALSGNLFTQTTLKDIFRILCDAFMLPGVLAICAGFLVMIANTGFFSGVKYLGKSFLGVFIPGIRLKQKRYKDFKENEDKKEKIKNYGFLFLTGCVFSVIGLVFLVLFYV